MTLSALPPIASLPQLTIEDHKRILDLLFEPSTELHNLILPKFDPAPFESYSNAIDFVGGQLTTLAGSQNATDRTRLDTILGSHPRLGAPKVESLQSQSEQRQLRGTEDEAAQLRRLNDDYEAKFPGLRYVVFVNGRSRPVIMDDMRARIRSSSIDQERLIAIQAMCDIAKDRATKLSP